MSAPVCSIDCIGTLYSCVYNPVSSISCGSFISRSFPGSGILACTLASLVALYWHDLILWPQSDHRRRRCQSEFAAQLSRSVCLTSRWHTCTWQVTEIARPARTIQYGTEAASSCLACDLWPLLGRQICMYVVNGASIRLHVLYAPGGLVTHWLAWPAHTSCVQYTHHALAWIFHVRL